MSIFNYEPTPQRPKGMLSSEDLDKEARSVLAAMFDGYVEDAEASMVSAIEDSVGTSQEMIEKMAVAIEGAIDRKEVAEKLRGITIDSLPAEHQPVAWPHRGAVGLEGRTINEGIIALGRQPSVGLGKSAMALQMMAEQIRNKRDQKVIAVCPTGTGFGNHISLQNGIGVGNHIILDDFGVTMYPDFHECRDGFWENEPTPDCAVWTDDAKGKSTGVLLSGEQKKARKKANKRAKKQRKANRGKK